MKVLIVEDEVHLADAIAEILKQQKIAADVAYSGETGLDAALTGTYDVIVLDIMLPKISGLDILAKVRENGLSVPILMLTAKTEVHERVTGLMAGADDYMSKPFSTDEFVARIKALARRKGEFIGNQLSYNGLMLDTDSHELHFDGNVLALSTKEFEILEMFMKKAGTVVQKERLIEKVWGFDSNAEYNTAEVYISFLRKKIAALGCPVQIKSIRGLGYKLE